MPNPPVELHVVSDATGETAARLVQARDYSGKAPVIDTDVLPKKKTYKQNWPAYDEAQTTEKHRFQILLHDLCRGIEEPPIPTKGRRPHSLRDMVFASAFSPRGPGASRSCKRPTVNPAATPETGPRIQLK